MDGVLSGEELLQQLQLCAEEYQHANPDSPPLSVRTVLGWIAAYDELIDCVLQEVPAAELSLRTAQFKAACVSRGWMSSPSAATFVQSHRTGITK